MRFYEALFALLHRISVVAARQEKYAPESAALLISILQFLNLMTALLLADRYSVLLLSVRTIEVVGVGALVLLAVFNLFFFLSDQRWRNMLNAAIEDVRCDRRHGARRFATAYAIGSLALFGAVAWNA